MSSSIDSDRPLKAIDLADLIDLRGPFGTRTRSVVLTNGCFDLLHSGHIQTINGASGFGDVLVVALNSDDSVRRLKGEDRPADRLRARIKKLSELESVDHIVVFNEDTPVDLIDRLRPDVLVKGGDYSPDQVVGGDLVESYGGQIRIVPFLEGHSTTSRIGTDRENEP